MPKLNMYLNRPANTKMFDQIKELNSEFWERTFHYSLFNNNTYSVVPTIIFLCWTFIILFLNVHTVAISFRNLKTLFYQVCIHSKKDNLRMCRIFQNWINYLMSKFPGIVILICNNIIFQQITFHWIFFYVARLWFLFIKFSRWLTMKMDVLLIVNLIQKHFENYS